MRNQATRYRRVTCFYMFGFGFTCSLNLMPYRSLRRLGGSVRAGFATHDLINHSHYSHSLHWLAIEHMKHIHVAHRFGMWLCRPVFCCSLFVQHHVPYGTSQSASDRLIIYWHLIGMLHYRTFSHYPVVEKRISSNLSQSSCVITRKSRTRLFTFLSSKA